MEVIAVNGNNVAQKPGDAPALSENRGAFFGSILGTLNHILVGDTIWLKRFSDHSVKLKSLDSVRDLERPKTKKTRANARAKLTTSKLRWGGVRTRVSH